MRNICIKTNVPNTFRVSNQGIIMTCLALFWSLYYQLQRHGGNPVEHLRWSFLLKQLMEKSYNFQLDCKYASKLRIDFTYIALAFPLSTLILSKCWLGYLQGFSTSLMSTFIQMFQKLFSKINSNILMLKDAINPLQLYIFTRVIRCSRLPL